LIIDVGMVYWSKEFKCGGCEWIIMRERKTDFEPASLDTS